MRTLSFLCRRLVCWLKDHDLEQHEIRKAQLRGRALTCRRCNVPVAFAKKPLPKMAVPRG